MGDQQGREEGRAGGIREADQLTNLGRWMARGASMMRRFGGCAPDLTASAIGTVWIFSSADKNAQGDAFDCPC